MKFSKLPYNLEAEVACLGSVLMKNSVAESIFSKIEPNDFYDGRNKIIAEYIQDHINKASQAPIDIISLTDRLKESDKITNAGGIEYISNIIDSVPTTSNAEHYADIVKGKAVLRQIIECGNSIIGYANDNELSVPEALDRSQKELFNISKTNTQDYLPLKAILEDTINTIETNYKNKGTAIGIETGFTDIDNKVGGFHNSNLIIIGGRPAMGKTAFIISVAENIAIKAQNRVGVGIFSLEMSKHELCLRILCSQSRIPSEAFRKNTLSESDWPRLFNAANNMSDAPIFIDDTPSLGLYEISSKARKMVQEGAKLIIVDYLQLMGSHESNVPREQHIASISRGLKRLAKELEIPVIALTQLNRGSDKRDDKKPFLSDIRESGSIEQDADQVIFIHRQEVYEPEKEEFKNKAEIIIAKNRHGQVGIVEMFFHGAFTRFENLERVQE